MKKIFVFFLMTLTIIYLEIFLNGCETTDVSSSPNTQIEEDLSVTNNITYQNNNDSNKITNQISSKIATSSTVMSEINKGSKVILKQSQRTKDIENSVHKHSYNAIRIVSATCENNGYITYECNCGASYTTKTTIATGHSFNNWQVVEQATTEKAGNQYRKCLKCGKQEWSSIPKLSAPPKYVTMNDLLFLEVEKATHRRQKDYDEIVKAVDELGISTSMTEIEAVERIFNYINKICHYDSSLKQNYSNVIWHCLNGRATCIGYASTFEAMCLYCGIKAETVVGEANIGGYHAWNKAVVNGKTLYFDTTLADQFKKEKYYALETIEHKEQFVAGFDYFCFGCDY